MVTQVVRYLSRDILLSVVLCGLWACSETKDTTPTSPMTNKPVDMKSPPSSSSDGGTAPPARMFVPEPARLHRLTRTQYLNSLRELLGEQLVLPSDLEVDTPIYGFNSIGAASLTIAPRTAEQFEQAAYDMAQQVMASTETRASILNCEPQVNNSDCARSFIFEFGLKAWRRPLSSDEIDAWSLVYTRTSQIFNNGLKGIEFVLAGLLQSPHFLFRVEYGTPIPDSEGKREYTSYEMASRLSYLIWQSTPDSELLQAASEDSLRTPEGLAIQIERMLSDSKARQGLSQFFREYLKLDRLDQLAQDPDTFPQVTETLGVSMRTEILLLAEETIFDRRGDIRKLFDSSATFVNAELARLYTLPDEVPQQGFVRVDLPSNSPRAGVLTSGGFLALNAHANLTSPTLRGRFIRQFLMCQDVPPPPAGVETTLPEPSNGPQTLRQRLETLHLADAQCAGCHVQMDPLGFGFENFDAIGAYRTMDNGLPIDASGVLDGKSFKNAKDLSRLIAENPKFAQCLTVMMFRHAAGHLESRGEEVSLIDVYETFVSSGYDFKTLVTAVVTSDAFRFAKEATP